MKKLLILLAAVLTLSACDFTDLEDAIDEAKIIIGLEEIETAMSVAFVDAKTGELYDKSQLDITIVGSNAQYAIDMFSDPFVGARVKEGLISFGIPNDVTPTEENPLVIEIEVSGQHVITSTGSVRFTNRGSNEADISVIDKRNMPDNMVMNETNIERDEDGRTTEEVTISNAPANTSARLMNEEDPCANLNQITSAFGITIPAGTVAPSTLSLFSRFGKVYDEDVTSGDLCGEVELLPSGATDSFEMLNTFTENGLRTLSALFSTTLSASSDLGEEAVLQWTHRAYLAGSHHRYYTDRELKRLYEEGKAPIVLFQPENSSDFIEITNAEFIRIEESFWLSTYKISINSHGLGRYFVIDPGAETFNKHNWGGIYMFDHSFFNTSVKRYDATFEAAGMSVDFKLPANGSFNFKDLLPIDYIPEMRATLYIHGPTSSTTRSLWFGRHSIAGLVSAPNLGPAKNLDLTILPVCPNPNEKLYIKGGIPTATLRYRPSEATNSRFRWRTAREMTFVNEGKALVQVRIKADDVLENYNYDLILHFDGDNYRISDVDFSSADSKIELEIGGGLCS